MSRDKSREAQPEEVITARRRKLSGQYQITSFFVRFILLILMLWVIFGVVFGVAPMRNADMAPRISAGDLMLYYRMEKEFHSGDVVLLKKEGREYAGRIVAKGGDEVEITENSELKVNGSLVVENDIYYKTPRYDTDVLYPVVLGEDEYFVLCDYREGARDSRYYGAVNTSQIKGKVITVIRRSNL